MFVYSVKASSLKYIAVMLVCAVAIAACVFMFPDSKAVEYTGASGKPSFKNVKTNDDRVKFLEGFGWEIEPEALDICEVVIPSEFDDVYTRYNDIQKSEGLDLKKYSGKSVKKYSYRVKNYESDTSVIASLLIYKNRVIGGDISSSDINGFSHGFTKPISE